jgi:CHAT domain-containing protein
LNNQDLLSALLTITTPTERRRFLEEHAARIDREFVAAFKLWADEQEQQAPQIASRISTIAAEVAGLLSDDGARAIAAVISANALRSLGQHQEAVVWYEKAAGLHASAGDELGAALAQVGLVNALTQLDRYSQALNVADSIGAVFDAQSERLARAKLDMNLGVLYARLARYECALAHYEAARDTFAALGDAARVAMLDANRANLLTDLDDFRTAETLYHAARQAFSQAGMASAAAQVDQSIAFLSFAQGQFDSALRLFDRARDIFNQTHQPVAVADVELDKSEVYLRLNLLDEAWAACGRAEPIFRAQNCPLEVGHVLLNRALVYLGRGNLGASAPLLAEAAQVFEEEDSVVWKALVQINQAILLLRAGQPDEALKLAQEAGELFREKGLRTRHCLALSLAGDAHQARGDGAAAEIGYRAALAAVEDLAVPWLTYRCHHGLGRVHQAGCDRQAAYAAYRRAIQDLEHVTSSLGIEPHRIAFLQDKLGAYEDLILLCLEPSEPERIVEAFEYVERAKSRALVDLLLNNLSGRVQPHDEAGRQLVSELERLREELNWHYNRLHDHNPDVSQRSPAAASEVWREITRLEEQAGELMHRMRVRYTDYLSLHQVQFSSLDAIRACLPPRGLLVEFYVAHDTILAFTLNEEGVQVYRNLMGPGEVEHCLQAFRFQINKFRYGSSYADRHQAILRAGVDRSLKALYDGLLAPMSDALEDRPLVIIPHAMLHYVPFHALYDGKHYLVEDHLVYAAPSAGVLRLCCSQAGNGGGPGLLLGVADASIPNVIDEVEGIRSLMVDAELFTGPEATLDRLRASVAGKGFVHVASHALFRSDNPLFSALRLADGWLNVNDIYELTLDARLVTLSGCETGMGWVARGDELIGLSRAFFYAGAPCLVVSLWAINDQSTATLMQHFYRTLGTGSSVAESLRQAQLELMARFGHPYYWASFGAIGDGRVRLA